MTSFRFPAASMRSNSLPAPYAIRIMASIKPQAFSEFLFAATENATLANSKTPQRCLDGNSQ